MTIPYKTAGGIVMKSAIVIVGLTFLGQLATPAATAAQVPQVRWNIRATVVDIVDPGGLFPDIRLGDPVRGTLKYDLTLWAHPFDSRPPRLLSYTNDTWYEVVTMAIENPRTGSEMEFATDPNGEFADVDIVNNWVDEEDVEFDRVFAFQSVSAPGGFTGTAPIVAFLVEGPPTTIADATLPSSLNLDDWPIALLAFTDLFAGDVNGTSIAAEIYELTPVIVPEIDGDFDFNGAVDAGDVFVWKAEFGRMYQGYSDIDGDNDIDGTDFLVLQRQLGAGAAAARAIPEPLTVAHLLIGCVAGTFILRRPTS